MSKRAVLLALTLATAVSAQTLIIRPVDETGNPVKGASAAINYYVNGDGSRSLKITDTQNSGILTFNCDNCDVLRWEKVTITPPDTSSLAPVSLFETPDEYKDISSNANTPTDTTVVLLFKWRTSPVANDTGSFLVPGIIYQMLYDPPGDGSQATLKQGIERTTSLSTSVKSSLGAELTLGYGYNSSILNVGAEFEVSAGVNYRVETSNEFTVSISENEEIKTSDGENMQTVGPGRGDVVVTQGIRVRWALGRTYLPGHPNAHTDGYVYKFFYAPVPNSGTVLKRVTQNFLSEEFKDHQHFIQQVLDASAIDPVSSRIKKDLIGSPRLSFVERVQISGDLPFTREYSASQTQTTTLSQEVEVGASVMAKITAGGASVGTKLSMSFTTGSSQSSSTTHSRSFSLTYFDNEPWDVTFMDVYVDNKFGVYVFDVDSTQSLSSYPFEDLYSRPAVSFTVTPDASHKSAFAGDKLIFNLSVLNTSLSTHSGVNVLNPVGVQITKTSGATVSVDPLSSSAGRTTPSVFALDVQSANSGSYEVSLEFNDPRGEIVHTVNLTAEFVTLVDGIELVANKTFFAVPFSLPDTVQHTFKLTVKNTSEQSKNIELGFSDQANGVEVSMPSQYNSVEAGGSRSFDVTLKGVGGNIPYSVNVWAQHQGILSTRKLVHLTMDTLAPALVLTYPNEGDTLKAGESDTLKWSWEGNVPQVTIEYSVNGGTDWTSVASGVDNTGSFVFTVPDIQTSTARFRISKGTSELQSQTTGDVVIRRAQVSAVETNKLKESSNSIVFQFRYGKRQIIPITSQFARVNVYSLNGRLVSSAYVRSGSIYNFNKPMAYTGGTLIVEIKEEGATRRRRLTVF